MLIKVHSNPPWDYNLVLYVLGVYVLGLNKRLLWQQAASKSFPNQTGEMKGKDHSILCHFVLTNLADRRHAIVSHFSFSSSSSCPKMPSVLTYF